jgi:hypothetical protein
MRRVRSVGIVSLLVGSIVASAGFDYAALIAAWLRLAKTIATVVVSLLTRKGPAITSLVCTHSIYVQLYT